MFDRKGCKKKREIKEGNTNVSLSVVSGIIGHSILELSM